MKRPRPRGSRLPCTRAALLLLLFSVGASAQESPGLGPDLARWFAWEEDLTVARDLWLASDLSFSPAARDAAAFRIDALLEQVGDLNDAQLELELGRIAALSENAHTRAYYLRNRSFFRRFPIRVWWFEDELRVVAAAPGHLDLIGTRVLAIGGRPVEEVKRQVDELQAGRSGWKDYKSVYHLTSPETLQGLGLGSSPEEIVYRVERDDGTSLERILAPQPRLPANTRTEAWRALAPEGLPEGWGSVLDGVSLPVFLTRADRDWTLCELSEHDALYVRISRSPSGRRAEMGSFLQEVHEKLEEIRATRIVLDLRFHTGGDTTVAREALARIAASESLRAEGGVVVLTSGVTFSAGQNHALQLLARPGATWIGEPMGDGLAYWSEGGNVELSHCGLTLHFADGFHSYDGAELTELQSRHLHGRTEAVSLPRLVPARPDWRSHRDGVDPLLEAALAE